MSILGENVQFGCGLCCPEQWLNFDSSPRLWWQLVPVLGRLVPSSKYGRFPSGVRYGDVVRGLPIRAGSVKCLYSSHVLEHLALDDLRGALRECRRVLAEDGFFRLVVPDLNHLIENYNTSDAEDRAVRFVRATLMGVERRERSFLGRSSSIFGAHRHLWMWDYPALAAELRDAGFRDVRPAEVGDSRIPAFSLVEDPARWLHSVGIQCRG